MSKQTGRNQPMCGDCKPSQRTPHNGGKVDAVHQPLAQTFVFEKSLMRIKRGVIRYQSWSFPVARCEVRLATQRFDVLRKKLRRPREPPGPETRQNLSRRNRKTEY